MEPIPCNSPFPATRWTMVLRVRATENEGGAMQALSRLCEDYWYPLYAYVRRRGYSASDAQDLTQGFFLQALKLNLFASADPDRGKLRTYLLKALERYLSDVRAREQSARRGGKFEFVSLEAGEARYVEEQADANLPDRLFARVWAYTVVDVTLRQLATEEAKAGRGAACELLQPFLTPDAEGEADYDLAARQLGCNVDDVRHAVSRLRRRFREVLRRQIADTLQEPTAKQIDEELAALRSALAA